MTNVDEVRALLGKCFYIGFDGHELPAYTSEFIRKNFIGGVSLFACNYDSPAQVAELCNAIQEARAPAEPPVAIAVDHEGGKVQRFKRPFTLFPDARTIADLNSPKLAFEVAEVQARELKAVGINVVYAPVADIDTNPKNPVIGRRAYGSDEEQVSKMVSAVIRGFLTSGVQPVLKHFPGHGDTHQDSHFHLPRVSTSLDRIRNRELKPFSRGFRSRCEMVMTAHIVVDSIDPDLPATLSTKVLGGHLRNEMRYRGLIISDDMEMKAITDNYGEIEAPMMALEAGVDILLYHTEPFSVRAFEGLLQKLTGPQGAKALAALRVAANRVDDFRKRHFLPYKAVYVPEIQVVGCEAHYALAKKVETGIPGEG